MYLSLQLQLYDYLLTFEDEVRYREALPIYDAHRSLGKSSVEITYEHLESPLLPEPICSLHRCFTHVL